MRQRRLRDKLLLRFGGSLALGFLLFGGGLFILVSYRLIHNLDSGLAAEREWVAAAVSTDPSADEPEILADITEHAASRRNQLGALMFSPAGDLVYSSFEFRTEGPPAEEAPFVLSRDATVGALRPALAAAAKPKRIRTMEFGESSIEYRIFIGRLKWGAAEERTLVLLGPLSDVRAIQHQLLLGLLVLIPGVGLPFLFWAQRASLTISRPLERMARDVEQVSVRSLGHPLDIPADYREIGSLVDAYRRMTERLDQSIQAITRFTADASHELRTPLAAMKSQYQAALLEGGADSLRPALESGLDEISALEKVVNALLMLSRYDSGKMSAEQIPVDLTDLVIEQCGKIEKTALAADVRILMEEMDPVRLLGDPTYLALMAVNVLENAVKYNSPGGRVSVRLVSLPGEPVCRLTIADTGIGIPASALPHVFDRFYRVDTSRSRDIPGSGLGLSLVRMIVEIHGGTVVLDSREGAGTRVEITLPRSQEK